MANTSASTGDTTYEDIKSLNDLERTKNETLPLGDKGIKGAVHNATSKLLKGVKNIAEDLGEM